MGHKMTCKEKVERFDIMGKKLKELRKVDKRA
jgi:hypothetical protein